MEEKDTKKYRQRKKQKYNTIRQQMEFYFGDSNLTKDRYLNKLVKESSDSFVCLEEFLKFNKIKILTDNVDHIRKAISNSEILELSADGKKVRRKTEILSKPDVDECTLYVESLPRTATHEYVKEIFSKYGNVVYVSLPRYRLSKRIKEFGFIEFEDKECVERALTAFKEIGGVLQYEDAKPDELKSVVSFNEEQKMKEGTEEQVEAGANTEGESEAHTETEDTDTEPPPLKKRKVEEDQENKDIVNKESSGEVDKEVAEKMDETGETNKTIKKKRKNNNKNQGVTDDKIFDLKIMPKREWKRLRNKYLNLQRERYKEIKQKLLAGRKQQEKKQKKKAQSQVKTPLKTPPRKINFYGALPDRKSSTESNTEDLPPPAKKPLFSFEPGLIVNIKFPTPLVDLKEFKKEFKQLPYVKYIDVKEGNWEAFIRVDKTASANQLVKQMSPEYQTQILSGEVEQHYWNKMQTDREQKLNKKIKVKQVRGRAKLQKKIATHIRFD